MCENFHLRREDSQLKLDFHSERTFSFNGQILVSGEQIVSGQNSHLLCCEKNVNVSLSAA